LEKPIAGRGAAMLMRAGGPFGIGWSFQPVPNGFSHFLPNPILLNLFITSYSFRIAMRT